MRRIFLLLGFLLIQLYVHQPVFAQYPMTYDYLMEFGIENFDYGDYQEALHYFKKAQIINPGAKEPARYMNFINDFWEKEKIKKSQKEERIVRVADLYAWERGLEQRLEESLAQHRQATDAVGKRMELILKQNQEAVSEIFELREGKQTLISEIADLKTEIKKLAGQVEQSQASAAELFKLREINEGLHQEIALLEKKLEELRTQREEEQANFYKQLKEEIAGVRQRYTQRLKDVRQKLEKAEIEREKIYKQLEEMIARIAEKGQKILKEKAHRGAEEEALDKYEKEARGSAKGGKR